MKKIKLTCLSILILLFTNAIFISCSDENIEEQSSTKSSIENLNTIENRSLIKNLYTEGTELNNTLKRNIKEAKENEEYKRRTDDLAEIQTEINNYRSCAECPQEYKAFMIPFIEEMVETEDTDLLNLINEYELKIEEYNTDILTKENLKFVLYSIKEAASYNLTESNTSSQQRLTENKVALGIAGGFITGCATGAYIGGTVGTVTVPIIGTVVGAVSGCIAGGAWSATMGAAAGGFFSLFD